MNILYLMDPIVDFDNKFDDRSFVAKTDLNAVPMAKNINSQQDLKVSYAALSTILNKRDIRHELIDNQVDVIEFDVKEISDILTYYNTNPWAALTGKSSKEFYDKIEKYFRNKLKETKPDFVIYWENISEVVYKIFPDAIFLEGSHTGFWTIEENADILFKVIKQSKEISQFNKDSISRVQLSASERAEVSEFRSFFRDHVVYQTQATRALLDPTGQFNYFICYPGNFPSAKFKKHAKVSTNTNIVKYLLEKLPSDCAILYTPHNLDKESLASPIFSNHRLIDLTRFKEIDKDFTIKAVAISDAVVNVYSNIFMPAMALGIPVFSIGDSPNAQFSLGKVEQLKEWLLNGKVVPESYRKLEENTLNYILTKKVNSSTLRLIRNAYNYIATLKDNIQKRKEEDCLPVLSTVRGYKDQFRRNRLLKNKFIDSYKPSNYDILLGNLLNPNIENIGFDVFDTLLCRPFVKPTDLFDLMEHEAAKIIQKSSINFKRTRIAAENIARHGKVETSFEEIYNVIREQLELNYEQLEALKELELKYESKYLKSRESVLNFFRVAKRHGKRIFIASDMYLPSDFIKKCLTSNGYNLEDVEIYISCENNAAKYDGSLFEIIENELSINPCQTVFIGDNLKSDIAKTSERGYNAFHYPKAIEKLYENILFTPNVLKFQADASYSFHLGFLANRIFDNPFVRFETRTAVNNSAALLGYMIYGPLALSVTDWLAENLSNKNYDKVLFSSRDSRVIIDIYNYLSKKGPYKNLPSSEYIYISRTATLPAYCDKTHILTLLSLYNSRLSTGDFLNQVFDIDLDSGDVRHRLLKFKINPELENRVNIAKIPTFLNDYFSADESIKLKLKCLKGYFEPFIKNQKVACFDLGSKGTSRDILSDLFEQNIDLYLFRTIRYKCQNNITAYMQDDLNPYRHGIRSVLPQFYELLLSDPLHKTCMGYREEKGSFVPVVEYSDFTKSSLLVIEAQRYVRDFCYEYIDLFLTDTRNINAQSRNIFIHPLSYLCANTTDQELLSQFDGDDPFWSKGSVSIISKPLLEGKREREQLKGMEIKSGKNINSDSNSFRLIRKLQNNPSEYLRDSSIPALRLAYKLSKIPLIGKKIENFTCNKVKTILLSK